MKNDEVSIDGNTLKNNETTLFNSVQINLKTTMKWIILYKNIPKLTQEDISKSILKQALGLNNFTVFLLLGFYLAEKLFIGEIMYVQGYLLKKYL